MRSNLPFRVISCAQQKGGAGKTTMTRLLAEWFALVRGLRVLVFDLDPQCSLSKLMVDMDLTPEDAVRPPVHPEFDPHDPSNEEWNGRSSSTSVYTGGVVFPYPVRRPETSATLEILPGDSQLLEYIARQEKTPSREPVLEALRTYLTTERSAVQQHYDVVLLDTPPSRFILSKSAIRASTHLVIPMVPSQQCLDGLGEMLTLWRQENARRQATDALEIACLQLNLVKARRSADQIIILKLESEEFTNSLLSPVVLPDRSTFAERDLENVKPRSIFQMPPSTPARQLAVQCGEFIEQRVYGRNLERVGETRVA